MLLFPKLPCLFLSSLTSPPRPRICFMRRVPWRGGTCSDKVSSGSPLRGLRASSEPGPGVRFCRPAQRRQLKPGLGRYGTVVAKSPSELVILSNHLTSTNHEKGHEFPQPDFAGHHDHYFFGLCSGAQRLEPAG